MHESRKIEKHHVRYDMRPLLSYAYKGFKVYIAEGGPKFEYSLEITRNECPNGYYDVIFTIEQDEQALFEVPIYIDYLHNPELTAESKKRARVNVAKISAEQYIDDIIETSK